MPNYCYNSIQVTGSEERVKEFHDRWLKPTDPLHDKVVLPTLRVLDMCAVYAAIEKKLENKHGKKTIREIINFAYDNIYDIDFLDDRKKIPVYPYNFSLDEYQSFDKYFKSFIKNIYNILRMTPRQRDNHRLLRNKWYEDNADKYSFHNLVAPDDIIPYRGDMPPIKDTNKMNERLSAYYFNLKNIGQKWTFPSDITFDWVTPGVLLCQFDTAWSPADIFIAKVSKMYPDLEFELECREPAMMLAGYVTYFNGELVKQDWYDGNSYAGYQLFCEYAEEDTVHEMKDDLDMTVEEIIEDCEGHISKEDIYRYLDIRKVKATRLDKI